MTDDAPAGLRPSRPGAGPALATVHGRGDPAAAGGIGRLGAAARGPWGAVLWASGAALLGAAWAWWWLGREAARLTDLIGSPFELDAGRVVDHAMVCAAVALLAWLLGARTHVPPVVAAAVGVGTIVAWTGAAYVLLGSGQLAAWPGFAGPDHLGTQMELAFGPRWVALAGPVSLAVVAGVTAFAAARTLPAPGPAAGSPWGSALVGVGVVVASAASVALQVAVWPSEVLGAWPLSELAAWPTVTLAVTVAVGWAASGRGSGVVVLTVLAAALLYLGDDMATEFQHIVAIPTGLVAALLAAAHRPFARTLAGLLA